MRFWIVAVLALGLGGCSFIDWLAGVDSKGNRTGDAPAGIVGTVVNTILPGGGAVIGGLTTLWAALRARAWKAAVVATADVIEKGAEAGSSVKDIKANLKVAHTAAGVASLVKGVVDKYGHSKEA